MDKSAPGRLQCLIGCLRLPQERRDMYLPFLVELDRALRRSRGCPTRIAEAVTERWCSRGLSKEVLSWLADALCRPAWR